MPCAGWFGKIRVAAGMVNQRCRALPLFLLPYYPGCFQYSGALPLTQSTEGNTQVQSTESFIGNLCRIRAKGTAYRNECDLSRCSAPSYYFITSCFYQYSGVLPLLQSFMDLFQVAGLFTSKRYIFLRFLPGIWFLHPV